MVNRIQNKFSSLRENIKKIKRTPYISHLASHAVPFLKDNLNSVFYTFMRIRVLEKNFLTLLLVNFSLKNAPKTEFKL